MRVALHGRKREAGRSGATPLSFTALHIILPRYHFLGRSARHGFDWSGGSLDLRAQVWHLHGGHYGKGDEEEIFCFLAFR
jgi:hypothetical protein